MFGKENYRRPFDFGDCEMRLESIFFECDIEFGDK